MHQRWNLGFMFQAKTSLYRCLGSPFPHCHCRKSLSVYCDITCPLRQGGGVQKERYKPERPRFFSGHYWDAFIPCSRVAGWNVVWRHITKCCDICAFAGAAQPKSLHQSPDGKQAWSLVPLLTSLQSSHNCFSALQRTPVRVFLEKSLLGEVRK